MNRPVVPRLVSVAILLLATAADLRAAPSANFGQFRSGVVGSRLESYLEWNDAVDDSRDPAVIGIPGLELTRFAAHGDILNLDILDIGFHGLAVLDQIQAASGAGSPLLQMAIDTDRVPGSGRADFLAMAQTNVADDARWEYLAVVRFDGTPRTQVYDQSLAVVATGPAAVQGNQVFFQFYPPWVAFPVPPATIRITVALFANDGNGNAQGFVGVSRAHDALTDYGDPGSDHNTAEEIFDDRVDHHVDIHVRGDEFRFSPRLIVTEAFHGPSGPGDWVELMNTTLATQDLSGFAVGDEETPDGAEGMGAFPAGASLAAGDVVVVATDPAAFQAAYGFAPDFETSGLDPAVPDLTPLSGWATTAAISLDPAGDEVVVMAPDRIVHDALVYGAGAWPGTAAHPGMTAGHSLARRFWNRDHDNCAGDFEDLVTPSPGVPPPQGTAGAGPGPAGPGGLRLAGVRPNPVRVGALSLVLEGDAETASLELVDALGRRVRRLFEGALEAGERFVTWNGTSDTGSIVPPGVYFVVLRTAAGAQAAKVALLR